jgi:phage-related protein
MDNRKPSEIAEKIIEQVKSTLLKEFLKSHPLTFEVKAKGVDRVQEFLGHTRPNTTRRYAKMNPTGLKSVLRE